MAAERKFQVSAVASPCGGLPTKPVVIALLCALPIQQRILDLDGLAEGEECWQPTFSM